MPRDGLTPVQLRAISCRMIARLATQLLQPAIDHWQGRHKWPLTLIVSVVAMRPIW